MAGRRNVSDLLVGRLDIADQALKSPQLGQRLTCSLNSRLVERAKLCGSIALQPENTRLGVMDCSGRLLALGKAAWLHLF
jgi:hypothetical protein